MNDTKNWGKKRDRHEREARFEHESGYFEIMTLWELPETFGDPARLSAAIQYRINGTRNEG